MLRLDEPTRDGETEIVLITNLPAEVPAAACCDAYAGRWAIEGHYQTMTDLLHCEVPSLGRPRAALFAFAMSAVAGNALAVLAGNLRAAHGEEIAAEVSLFALLDEVAEVYPGMMLAVPPADWPRTVVYGAEEVAAALNDLAARVPVHRMFRCRRGPKKPRPKRSRGNRVHHVSNKKLLDRDPGGSQAKEPEPRRIEKMRQGNLQVHGGTWRRPRGRRSGVIVAAAAPRVSGVGDRSSSSIQPPEGQGAVPPQGGGDAGGDVFQVGQEPAEPGVLRYPGNPRPDRVGRALEMVCEHRDDCIPE